MSIPMSISTSFNKNNVDSLDGLWLGDRFYPFFQSGQEQVGKPAKDLTLTQVDGFMLGDRLYPVQFNQSSTSKEEQHNSVQPNQSQLQQKQRDDLDLNIEKAEVQATNDNKANSVDGSWLGYTFFPQQPCQERVKNRKRKRRIWQSPHEVDGLMLGNRFYLVHFDQVGNFTDEQENSARLHYAKITKAKR